MANSPESSGTARHTPHGFHNERQGQGNDAASIARIRADQQFPVSQYWLLGKWIGPLKDKPQWLIDKEQETSADIQPTTL